MNIITMDELNLSTVSAVVIPADARGNTNSDEMRLAKEEFPTSVVQYQNMCGRKAFRSDAIGRVKKSHMVDRGDTLTYVDLSSSSYREILESVQEGSSNLEEMFQDKKMLVFFSIVRTRPDKTFSFDYLSRSLKNIRSHLEKEGVGDVTIILPGRREGGVENVQGVFAGSSIDVSVVV